MFFQALLPLDLRFIAQIYMPTPCIGCTTFNNFG